MKIVKKLLKIVLVAFLVLVLAMGGFMIYMTSANGYKGNHKEVLSSQNGSPKAIVVYQPSLSKNSDDAAKSIAKGLNEKGYEVTLTYPGKHLSKNLSEYKVAVFGSVVYAGQPAKALIDYMTKVEVYPESVAVFSMGGLEEAPELDMLAALVKNSNVADKTKFTTSSDFEKQAYELGLSIGAR